MFIIVGIMIVSIVIIFILLRNVSKPDLSLSPDKNPNAFLSSCYKDNVEKSVDLLMKNGGYINPPLYLDFEFENEDVSRISYLCYYENYNMPCVNQEPMFIQHLKDEIKNYIKDDVKNCFDNLGVSLENDGYVVQAVYRGFDISLDEKGVSIDIIGELTLTKSGETGKETGFGTRISSNLYNLAIVSQRIVNDEVRNCDFDYINYMTIYPEYDIDKVITLDKTKIYTIKQADSEEFFRFAVRGCVYG